MSYWVGERRAKSSIISNSRFLLVGRGGATNNHPGNRHFREQVAIHQQEYLTARKKEKIGIARRIVAIIQSYGGRFLKRTKTDEWVEVDDKRAQEKTSQALREGLDVRNKQVRALSKLAKKAKDSVTNKTVIPGKVVVSPLTPEGLIASLCDRHKASTKIFIPDTKMDGTTQDFVRVDPLKNTERGEDAENVEEDEHKSNMKPEADMVVADEGPAEEPEAVSV